MSIQEQNQVSNQEIEDYIANGITKYKFSGEFLIKELALRGYGEEDARNLIAKVIKERHIRNKLYFDEEVSAWDFDPIKLIIGLVIGYFWLYIGWEYSLSLVIVVIIHELGHIVIGKSFGCVIEEMQVFLLSFLSYKPKHDKGCGSWKNIKWSLGSLPLGGYTTFKTQKESEEYDHSNESTHASPYINHKPAWQRLLIYAGGIGFNLATFFNIYLFLPSEWYFCNIIMILSLIMAVLNILPVFPLDGGQIIFTCYEMITGKKPASWFVNICGIIGLAFIVIFFWIFPEWLSVIIEPVIDIFF